MINTLINKRLNEILFFSSYLYFILYLVYEIKFCIVCIIDDNIKIGNIKFVVSRGHFYTSLD